MKTCQKGVAWYIQRDENKKPTIKNTLPGKVNTQNWKTDKEFPKQKLKEVHQP